MTEYRDFYQILGISPQASPAEIKTAYRALARKYHPDMASDGGNQEMFNAVTEAFRVLANVDLRNAYNKDHGHNYARTEEYDRQQELKKAEEKQDKKVVVGSQGVDQEAAWKRLREKAHDFDLKVGHKVALTPEEELDRPGEDAEYIAPWGEHELEEEETYGAKGGVLKRMLGSFRKTKDKRQHDKERLKRELDAASIPLQPSDPSVYEKRVNPVDNTIARASGGATNPFQGERVFQFQITPLEQALGTAREIAVSRRPGDPSKKIRVNIPAGIGDGKVLQLRQGWESVRFKISVVSDQQVFVKGLDIQLFVPTTVKEALDGVTVSVPTLEAPMHVVIPGGRSFASRIRHQGYGVSEEQTRARGDLYVQPQISLPDTETESLDEAIKSIGRKYTSNARSRFSLEEAEFVETGTKVITLPISIPEAFFGIKVDLPVSGGSVSFEIPAGWFRGTPRLTVPSARGDVLVVQPYVVAPDLIDDETRAAAAAIDAYNQHAVRDSMPRCLVHK